MKRPKCSRCKNPMRLDRAYRERRTYGPLGNYYIAEWQCDSCYHRTHPRVTRAVFKTLRVEVLE